MNLTNLSDNVKANPSGVSIPPITKRDVAVFGHLLMKCRSLDVSRRMQEGKKVANDPEVAAIRDFCKQALQDARSLAEGKSPKDIIRGGKE